MLLLSQEALPLVLAGAERRQSTVEALGPNGQVARGEVGDRLTVCVAPVETELELVGDLPEMLRGVGVALGHVLQGLQVERVATKGRALSGQRDRLPVPGRRADDGTVHRHRVADGDPVDGACIELLERDAVPVVEVVARGPSRGTTVGLTQDLNKYVTNILVSRRQTPRIVLSAPNQQIHRKADNGSALGLDAGAVEVNLHNNRGVVVPELWAHHRQRRAVS